MTRHEDERLAIVETKMDNIIEDIGNIKNEIKNVGTLCTELSTIKLELKDTKDNQKNFISKNGFITASVILGVIIAILTIIQFIRI